MKEKPVSARTARRHAERISLDILNMQSEVLHYLAGVNAQVGTLERAVVDIRGELGERMKTIESDIEKIRLHLGRLYGRQVA